MSGNSRTSSASTQKGTYWILTIPHQHYLPYLPDSVQYITGQLEQGQHSSEGGAEGFLHWQIFVGFTKQVRLAHVRKTFGAFHAEPVRDTEKAEAYCHKEETRIEGTGFTLGCRPIKRGSATDWSVVLGHVKSGEHSLIPADIYLRYFGNIERIAVKNAKPVGIMRTCFVFWGSTGTGKSRTAWEEATLDAYPKDPMSKFWDGYSGQEHVVIDEFRGSIAISHLLRWLDRYPVLVEVKGSSTVLKASKIWITSNLSPEKWYPDLDYEAVNALLRRLTVRQF